MKQKKLEILLSFLNTWRIPNDTRVPAEHLQSDQDLIRFRNSHFSPELNLDPLPIVRELRDELRNHLGNPDLSFLKRWLKQYPIQLDVEQNEITHRPFPSLCGELLSLVAEAIQQKQWERIKACPDCQWVFYDQTKNKGRVWCGMLAGGPEGRACGTIAKVKRWRERQKKQK